MLTLLVLGEALTERAPSLSPTQDDNYHSSSLEHLTVLQQDPTLIQNPAKPEKKGEETERPVPTPRHKTYHGTGWEKKDTVDSIGKLSFLSSQKNYPSHFLSLK